MERIRSSSDSIKKAAISTVVSLIVWVLVDMCFYLVQAQIDHLAIHVAYLTVSSVLFSITLFNTIYPWVINRHSLKIVLVVVSSLIFGFSIFLSIRIDKANKLYLRARTHPKYVEGNIWKADSILGHKPIPNATGYYNGRFNDSLVIHSLVKIGSDGFRVPEHPIFDTSSSNCLFLGCSWTFGDFVNAEQSYPYLVAKGLNSNCTNAAGSGYGLAQMKFSLDQLLANNHYDYVFFQLSPWLVRRATEYVSPSALNYLPSPYFAEVESGFRVFPPAFNSNVAVLGERVNPKPISYLDKAKFLLDEGLRIEFFGYFQYVSATINGSLGLTPKPSTKNREVEEYFFHQVTKQVLEAGSTPVVLPMKYSIERCESILKSCAAGTKIVDLNDVPFTGIYLKTESDSVRFDGHPSKYTHQLYAKEILNQLSN